MDKTVIITGSSSGIGKEAALYFAGKGWNVVATMRRPGAKKTGLEELPGVEIQYLDVENLSSIKQVIDAAVKKYGKIDALVNNAGYALRGAFEASTKEQVLKQYNINVFGLMDVIREILPVFRKQGEGRIINVASIGGRIGFPFYSLYQGTKWSVEGFSEALAYELEPFNIRVKIIEPGLIKTDFYSRSFERTQKAGLTSYDAYLEGSIKKTIPREQAGSHPGKVAKLIYKAATDRSWKLRYLTGANALPLMLLRRLLPYGVFRAIIKATSMG
jgi:NAD(P)-dependent dehydrogenase (short-subunit alcohol dehydrogenase family)